MRDIGFACGGLRPFHSEDLLWLILGWFCIFSNALAAMWHHRVQELTNALILVWEEIPLETLSTHQEFVQTMY